jgi:predicted lipoprotein with Yx(FWY)xxD motif
MSRSQARSAIAIGVSLIAATALVACGSNDSSASSSTITSTTAASGSGSSGDVAVADSGLGQILVDSNGMTIYLFDKDTSADASTCSGDCAQAWPPVTVKGTPKAGTGVDASKLTTLKRDDGTAQIAYNGHPLYLYAGDSAPGDTNGNDVDQFGAQWYAMTPAGESVGDSDESSDEDSASTSTTNSSSSGGYSY